MSNNDKLALQSLSMDLLRAALARHRGSHQTADRFILEANSRIKEIPSSPMTFKIMQALSDNSDRQAEDLLMYSTIIKNKALSYDQS